MGKDQSIEIILFHLFHIESKRSSAAIYQKQKNIFSEIYLSAY
jgi:hypothetical protein